MKELKDICCSLEVSKRLKEKGVKQDSLFYRHIDKDLDRVSTKEILSTHSLKNIFDFWISAFTATELLALLPARIYNDYENFYLDIHKLSRNAEYVVAYRSLDKIGNILYELFQNKKLPDALAEMLEYLIDNNLLAERKQELAEREKEGRV